MLTVKAPSGFLQGKLDLKIPLCIFVAAHWGMLLLLLLFLVFAYKNAIRCKKKMQKIFQPKGAGDRG